MRPHLKTPKISVLMPSLNQGAYLEAALQSVFEQDHPNTEIIVIDGGSKDETVSILQRYNDRIAYWQSCADHGQSDALNTALKYVTGDIIGWLNSDDTYMPNTFQQVAEVLQSEQSAIAMSRFFGLMDSAGIVFDRKENTYSDHETLVRYWATNGMTINQPCVFFRTHLLEGMDTVFDPGLQYAMDYDLWLRLTLSSSIAVVDGQWANYRFHDTSKSGTGFGKFFPEWYAVSQRHWGTKYSLAWWMHWIEHAYYRYPRRLGVGATKRMGRALNG